MAVQGFRIETSILGIQVYDDGRSILRFLPSGAEVVPVSPVADNGQLEITWSGLRLWVFAADLENRARPVIIDDRFPRDEESNRTTQPGTDPRKNAPVLPRRRWAS